MPPTSNHVVGTHGLDLIDARLHEAEKLADGHAS